MTLSEEQELELLELENKNTLALQRIKNKTKELSLSEKIGNFIPFPVSTKEISSPLELVTSPLKPLLNLEKESSKIAEAGRNPLYEKIDSRINSPIARALIKEGIRFVTPFTPTEFAGSMGLFGAPQLFKNAVKEPLISGSEILSDIYKSSPKVLETIKKAEKMGIDLPLGARTESPSLLSTEASLINRLGGEKIAQRRKFAEESFEDFSKEFAEKFGKEKLPSEVGSMIVKEFDKIIKEKNAISKNLYDDLGKVAGDVLVDKDSSETVKFINSIFKERGLSLTPENQLISKLESVNPKDYKMLHSILNDISNKNLNYSDLKSIRTIVGELADFESIKASGIESIYKKVYSSLTKDLDKTASLGGYDKLAKDAKNFYKEFITFVDSPIAQTISSKRMNPDGLIDILIKPKSAISISSIMKEFGEEGKNYLRRGFLDKIFDNAIDNTVSGGKISPEKLATQLNKYSDDTLQSLFGANFETIQSIRDVSNALARGSRFRSGSPTSFLQDIGEGAKLNPFPLASRILSRKWLSNILSNSKVEDLLTKGKIPFK